MSNPAGVSYNRLAGSSKERLTALSDGIFAVAMTLLVLDLHTPAKEAIHGEADLLRALGAMFPQVLSYLMSFLTLGIFWNGQQAQLNHLERCDRDLTWLHAAFLFAVTLLPFSTRLLAEFITLRSALLVYWANIVLLGGTLYLAWIYARRACLLRDDAGPAVDQAVRRRIVMAQLLYAGSAAFCVLNPLVSIAAIVVVQLNFVIAPRLRWFDRI